MCWHFPRPSAHVDPVVFCSHSQERIWGRKHACDLRGLGSLCPEDVPTVPWRTQAVWVGSWPRRRCRRAAGPLQGRLGGESLCYQQIPLGGSRGHRTLEACRALCGWRDPGVCPVVLTPHQGSGASASPSDSRPLVLQPVSSLGQGGQIPEEPICSLTPSVLQVSTSRSPFPPHLCLPLPYLNVSFPPAARSPNPKDLEGVVTGIC